MKNYLDLSHINKFIESKNDTQLAEMMYADSKAGRVLGKEMRKLTEMIPDEKGFYIWFGYNYYKGIEYYKISRSNNSDLPTLRKKIRRELSAIRVLFWNKYIKNDEDLWKIYRGFYNESGSYGHFKSCLNYRNANFIIWLDTPDKSINEMSAIHKYLKHKFNLDDFKEASLEDFIKPEAERIYNQFKSHSEQIAEMLNSISSEEELLSDTIKNDIEGYNSELGLSDKDGGSKQCLVSIYERNQTLRKIAVSLHGTSCKVCGFYFGLFYGERGVDYIEVHHLNPLSRIKTEHDVKPETDMTVLCSNCHRMIHRKRDEILSIDELKRIIRSIDLPRTKEK